MPGKCAAPPAPAMMTLNPAALAPLAKATMRSGVRWAETMRASYSTSSSSSVSAARRIVAQSDWEPMMMAIGAARRVKLERLVGRYCALGQGFRARKGLGAAPWGNRANDRRGVRMRLFPQPSCGRPGRGRVGLDAAHHLGLCFAAPPPQPSPTRGESQPQFPLFFIPRFPCTAPRLREEDGLRPAPAPAREFGSGEWRMRFVLALLTAAAVLGWQAAARATVRIPVDLSSQTLHATSA